MVLYPADYRGTNYTPSIARGFCANLGLTPWLPHGTTGEPVAGGGFFSRSHSEQEITAIASAGLNSIRIMGSFYGWLSDRALYLQGLKDLADVCNGLGVSITYALWNSTPLGTGRYQPFYELYWRIHAGLYVPSDRDPSILRNMFDEARTWMDARTIPFPTNEVNITQYPEPGPGEMFSIGHGQWDPTFFGLLEEFLMDVCTAFNTPPGIEALGSFDLYNEPDANWAPPVGGPFPERLGPTMDFIQWTDSVVQRVAPGALRTVGWAGLGSVVNSNHTVELERRNVLLDYYSFHIYAHPEHFAPFVEGVRQRYFRPGIPVVCSEFWEASYRGWLSKYIEALQHLGFGGQMWGFLQHNSYRWSPTADWDGVLIPTPATTVQLGSPITFTVADHLDENAVREW